MHNPPPDSESSGVYGSDVFPQGLDPNGLGPGMPEGYIDPAALETRRGMPAVTSMPVPPGQDLPSPLETTFGSVKGPHLPPLSAEDRQTLSRLLNRPQLHRFWGLVKEQMATSASGAVFLAEPSESERLAIAGVFGLTVEDGPLNVQLRTLDTSLRASKFGISLQQALLLVAESPAAGPTVPIPTSSAPSRETRHDPRQAPPREAPVLEVRPMSTWRQKAEVHPVVQRRPELFHWLVRLEEEGLPQTLAPGHEARLMQSVMEVLAALPGQGETLRPFAYRLLGDHHALDVGQPAGELIMQALAVISRRAPATTREERQKLWHWAGVEQDDVGSDVLTLGLRPAAATAFCRALDAMAQQGEPMRLTLRQIQNHDLKLAPGTRVYVSQHPVVVAAAAERFPAGCRPLVVSGERPGPAVTALLMALAKGGAKLFYHGDFDWHGIRVANDLYRTFPFQPWRFRTGDYLSQSQKQRMAPQLTGHPVYARWDDGLAEALIQKGMAIEEERVLPSLLTDLAL